MDFLFYGVAAINGYDAYGHYLRASLIVNQCSNYAVAPVAGCSANFRAPAAGRRARGAAPAARRGRARAAPAGRARAGGAGALDPRTPRCSTTSSAATADARRGGRPVLIGAVTLAVVVVAVYLSYNANEGLPLAPAYRLEAQAPSAANLVVGNEVRMGGARVGTVESIDVRRRDDGAQRRRARA